MNRPGMTLIELVVALVVAGAAVGAAHAVLASMLDHRARADEVLRASSRAAVQRHVLQEWLAGARLIADESAPGFRGMDGVFGRMPDDEISFITLASTPIDAAATAVRLYIDRDDATSERGLVAHLAEWRGLTTQRLEIDPRIMGLELRYLTAVAGERRWLPGWISSSVLPLAVELRMVPASGDTLLPISALPIIISLMGGQ